MKIKPSPFPSARAGEQAFSLVEAVVGFAILAITFVSLYAGISSGFAVTQLARENLRATQIMLERMECIRLFNWEQLNYSNMIPPTFTAYYYPLASNGESKGIEYSGKMWLTNASLYGGGSVETNMVKVIVTLQWSNGNGARQRSMHTYVSQSGMQNYIYSN